MNRERRPGLDFVAFRCADCDELGSGAVALGQWPTKTGAAPAVRLRFAPFLLRWSGLAVRSVRAVRAGVADPRRTGRFNPSRLVGSRCGQPGSGLISAPSSLDPILGSRVGRRLPLHIACFVRAAARERNHVVDLVAGARAGRQAGRRARVLALELPPDSRAPPDSARWSPRTIRNGARSGRGWRGNATNGKCWRTRQGWRRARRRGRRTGETGSYPVVRRA